MRAQLMEVVPTNGRVMRNSARTGVFLVTSTVVHLPLLLAVALLVAPAPPAEITWLELPPTAAPAGPTLAVSTAAHRADTIPPELLRGLPPSALSERLTARIRWHAEAPTSVTDTGAATGPTASAHLTRREARAPSAAEAPPEPNHAEERPLPVEIPAATAALVAAALTGDHEDPDDNPGVRAEVLERVGGATPSADVATRHVEISMAPARDRHAPVDRIFSDYYAYLRAKIHPLWHFPKSLELLGEEGTVIVSFIIHKTGRVTDIRITKRSGFKEFDENVVAAVRKAAPFRPLPDGLGRERLALEVPFDFDNPVVRWTP